MTTTKLIIDSKNVVKRRNKLRKKLIQEIEKLNPNREDFAKRLGLLPIGLEVLMKKKVWSSGTIVKVAEALEEYLKDQLNKVDFY